MLDPVVDPHTWPPSRGWLIWISSYGHPTAVRESERPKARMCQCEHSVSCFLKNADISLNQREETWHLRKPNVLRVQNLEGGLTIWLVQMCSWRWYFCPMTRQTSWTTRYHDQSNADFGSHEFSRICQEESCNPHMALHHYLVPANILKSVRAVLVGMFIHIFNYYSTKHLCPSNKHALFNH